MGKEMSEEKNPREYFEYYGDFLIEVNRSREETNIEEAEPIALSLFEIVKRTLETSVASSVEKKSILDGFAETIRNNIEELHELPESDKIETPSIVFNKFAEKLAGYIQDDKTPTKIFQKYEEQLQAIVAATKPQELAQDVLFLSESEVENPPIELGESFSDVNTPVFSAADRAIDPITRAIRTQILTKQRELIVIALVKNGTVEKEKIDDINEFRKYFENEQNKEKISEILKTDKDLKRALEQVEIIGYQNVHTEFAGIFTTMEWKDGAVENDSGITTRKQVVRDANGIEIATLAEATHKINPPHTVQKSDGTNVTINNYRTIDFPITLDNNGPMHLSLAVKDQNGKNIAASKAVYFTAHYDDDGKLVEVSSPHPVKFSGDSPDAVGYIEHGGQIYTLPVTQQKYKEMMQEVAKNLGHGVDISQSIEPLSVDLMITSRKDSPDIVGHIKPGEQMPVTQEEHKTTMQGVNKNPGQGVDISQSIDAPDLMVISRQDIEEAQLCKAQENMVPIDIVKRKEVVLEIEEKTVEHAPGISQAVLINSEARDKTESIRASLLKSQHIRPLARKSEEDITKLVGELSKSLEGKELENQKKDIDKELKNLSTPQEKIGLLRGLSKAVVEKGWEEFKKVGKNEPDAEQVRLRTEGRRVDGEEFSKIGHTQRKAEHTNVKGNIQLQAFLLDKIDEVSKKKPIITVRPQGTSYSL
ncbi:Sca4 family protein [Candidatus Tisiphia endosymbiont of Ptychoptera albimana]|uniref:Sca4 family protein n=1 Tax=Candidatus Tisiphia endosymbiont of Ptychoptera albimana TaxID=3066260 RepID=UPI001D4776FF|nr:Sca4 family protein [Rickettsia endosymbiont of Sericostoma sp. HW-2014]